MELDFGRQAFEERLDRFAKAYPGLLATRADAVAAVDLRYSNGFAVRWRRPDGGQPG
jgi:cell division protein FtsQ